jgi:hypothetical protein
MFVTVVELPHGAICGLTRILLQMREVVQPSVRKRGSVC